MTDLLAYRFLGGSNLCLALSEALRIFLFYKSPLFRKYFMTPILTMVIITLAAGIWFLFFSIPSLFQGYIAFSIIIVIFFPSMFSVCEIILWSAWKTWHKKYPSLPGKSTAVKFYEPFPWILLPLQGTIPFEKGAKIKFYEPYTLEEIEAREALILAPLILCSLFQFTAVIFRK